MDYTNLLPLFLKGFLLMASLIFAVGPQNAMLLRHGLRREHHFLVAGIFTLCDCLLISLGVAGVGRIISQYHVLREIIAWGGAAFLFWFAARSFRAAYRGGQRLSESSVQSRGSLIASAFMVSLFNPGAIIDTVVVVGTVSSQYSTSGAWAFGLGAQVFSTAFFFMVAAFAGWLAPTLSSPRAWRVIDVVIGLITLSIGVSLLLDNA